MDGLVIDEPIDPDEAVALGRKAFSTLSQMGLFGASLADAQLAEGGTVCTSHLDGQPILARFPLAAGVGFVDLALRRSLGDPVVTIVPGVTWDAAGFEARVAAHGFRGKGRWESYSTGGVALALDGALLDPIRSDGTRLYRVPPNVAREPWGLSNEQKSANVQRYDRIAHVIDTASPTVAFPHTLPICPAAPVPPSAQNCVPEILQTGEWCVPASLAMGIEYWLGLGQNAQRLQVQLATNLQLLMGGGLVQANLIPQAVSRVSGNAVTCALARFDGNSWNGVTQAIDANQPAAYVNSNHTVLVFGYSEASTSQLKPQIMWCVDPTGPRVTQLAFCCQPSGWLAVLAKAPAQTEVQAPTRWSFVDRLRAVARWLGLRETSRRGDDGH